ncbi:creatininase family protein [Streptomyces sp. NPDC050636]|uniref:creatininase family protein n=1 Tax=Streptomyces sp. NPDC050636 TaxID=3154510 RepID=UPI00342383FD
MNLLPTSTSTNIEEQQPSVAVLPVGSFEQHGRYLPLITPAHDEYASSRRASISTGRSGTRRPTGLLGVS